MMGCSPAEQGSAQQLADEVVLPTPDQQPTNPGPTVTQKCFEGKVAPDGKCVVNVEKTYTYNSEYNGRTALGENLTGTPSQKDVTIPTGYYSDMTATISDVNLVAGNIKSGINIFGVVGDLAASNVNDCTAFTDGTQVPASCAFKLKNDKYIYQQQYGGRNKSCVINSSAATGETLDGKCWLDSAASKYLSAERYNYPACTMGSLATSECKVQENAYLYSSLYGGRSGVCEINKINSNKCWINEANRRVYSVQFCKENPAVNDAINFVACFPSAIGNWVYQQPYGGRNVNCDPSASGRCYFDQDTKTKTDVDLVPANIKSGEKVFGVIGDFVTSGFYWGSGAHRTAGGANKRVVYTLPTLLEPPEAQRPYSVIETKVVPADEFPAHYRAVPNISTDNEVADISDDEDGATALVNRTGWGLTECGTANGKVDARIANCVTVFAANATWNGITAGNAGQGSWSLVSRKNISGSMYEVWRDNSTELLWSSRVSTVSGLNWCKASGNSNSQKVDENFREDDPSNICDSSTYQNNGINHPISACVEGFGGYLADDNDPKFGFLSTGTAQQGKAGLMTLPSAQKANGRVFWRLPTTYDYMLANHNGLRFVLPDISSGGDEWTATTFSGDSTQAWVFSSTDGYRKIQPKTSNLHVRCLGR